MMNEGFDISREVNPHESTIATCISRINGDLDNLKAVLDVLTQASSDRCHLAAIIDSAEDAIISKDLNGIVRSWNPSAERIFGYTQSEMIGESITKIIPQDKKHEESLILAKIRAGQQVRHFGTERQRKDGTLVPISLTVSPVRDTSGRIIGASKIARDTTSEVNLQREQNELIAKLKQALDEVKALRGLIPICANCKKIRDDDGYWQKLEKYFSEHGQYQFTHGICPTCAKDYLKGYQE